MHFRRSREVLSRCFRAKPVKDDVMQMANGNPSSPGLQWMITAVTSPILVILMSPEVDAFPTHTLTSAKHNHPATMWTNGFVRCEIGSRNRLLIFRELGNFHCWATFIQAVLLLALPYLTLFTAVCQCKLPVFCRQNCFDNQQVILVNDEPISLYRYIAENLYMDIHHVIPWYFRFLQKVTIATRNGRYRA
jgi:hypothetical protein